jgi:hypothetical protein
VSGDVQSIIKAFVKAVNEGDEFAAYVNFTRLRDLGISEDDLLTKGYVNVEKPTKLANKPVLKKKAPSKSRHTARRNK